MPTPQARLEAALLAALAWLREVPGVYAALWCGSAARGVDLLYAARGWWEVKRERWAGELGAREPAAARELDTVLGNGPTDTRQAALERLTTRVTGDLIHQDGGTEPECVGSEQSA